MILFNVLGFIPVSSSNAFFVSGPSFCNFRKMFFSSLLILSRNIKILLAETDVMYYYLDYNTISDKRARNKAKFFAFWKK